MTTPIDLTGVPGAPSGSRTLRGHLSRPAGAGPWPGVVVLHEAFAVDDVMRHHVDRLAGMGYLALMPDLFSDGGPARCLVSTFRSLRSGRGRAYADIEAARAFLAGHADGTGRVGVIGFCLGGGFALMCATRGFDVVSDNYGMLPKDVDGALEGACPVVAAYGGRDRSLPAGTVGTLEEALTRHGVEHEVTVHPTAGHSFLNDVPTGPRILGPISRVMNIGPEPVAAERAWKSIESFFARHLGPAPSA